MKLSDIELENLKIYSRSDVVSGYAEASYFTAAEKHLLRKHLVPSMSILDIGVGGGRTSPLLAKDAAEYIGIDYSSKMIKSCKRRFPHLNFRVMDASDLSVFHEGYFDLIVFSFNGLGYLYPEEKIIKCMRECFRILKPGGIFIFSLHHARSLFHRPPAFENINCIRPLVGSLRRSCVRFSQRIRTKAFWKRRGHIDCEAHGGLKTYMAAPQVVASFLNDTGFNLHDVVGDDFPRSNISWCTRWYYYAATKPFD